MKRTISRRSALKAGSAFAASAVLGGATAAARAPDDDPIFAVIEQHQAAVRGHAAAVNLNSDLHEELPTDRRQSSITFGEEKIVE